MDSVGLGFSGFSGNVFDVVSTVILIADAFRGFCRGWVEFGATGAVDKLLVAVGTISFWIASTGFITPLFIIVMIESISDPD